MMDDPERARARAEAKFKKKDLPTARVGEAVKEYAAGQKATLDWMAELKALRLAREASERKATGRNEGKAKRPKSLP
jgi:hypothetical protein